LNQLFVSHAYNDDNFNNFNSNNNETNISDFISPNSNSSLIDSSDDINWHNILFVKRHPFVRYTQLVIACYGLVESLFYFYLNYNVSIKNEYCDML
jgi:hypothetical protein